MSADHEKDALVPDVRPDSMAVDHERPQQVTAEGTDKTSDATAAQPIPAVVVKRPPLAPLLPPPPPHVGTAGVNGAATSSPKMNLILLHRHHQQLVTAQRGLQESLTQLCKQLSMVMQQNCTLHKQLLELQRSHKKLRQEHTLALKQLQCAQDLNQDLEARIHASNRYVCPPTIMPLF